MLHQRCSRNILRLFLRPLEIAKITLVTSIPGSWASCGHNWEKIWCEIFRTNEV